MPRRVGAQTLMLQIQPSILAGAAVAGKKEGEGPLGRSFDYICQDAYFGESSWEKAESAMLRRAFELACDKAGAAPSELDFILSGDLLNQCAGSAYALRDLSPPYFGLYGACSTMAESLLLGSLLLDGGCGKRVAALTSSHFCSAERQFRFPLEYGSVRTPTSQWTVTGAGALILADKGPGPYVTCVTPGRIVDAGITDSNNMGAAMAPAACDTLAAHFSDTGRAPSYYDAVITGDLGLLGRDIVRELMGMQGFDLGRLHRLRRPHLRRRRPGRQGRRLRLRLLGLRPRGTHPPLPARRGLEAGALRRHRRAHEPHHHAPGREHPRHLPRPGARECEVLIWRYSPPVSSPSPSAGRSAPSASCSSTGRGSRPRAS